ncbi:MAG: triose-phosphate isomerase [Nanoarchaeota archaeon]|nr:triose-phosphate isomerase [Nanoarchaeota archaeon]
MVIVVNFKNYVYGKKAIKLAKECKKVSKKIVLGVSLVDLFNIVEKTKMECYVQHIDYQEKGKNTGFNIVESVKENKGKGVFLNHSEHRLSFDVVKKTVKRCKELKLKTIIFAKDVESGKKFSKLKPNYICIEPPNLVGGKVSVSTAKPELIENSVKKIKAKVLVGAGIHSREDVLVAKRLGAYGVALSSAVCKSNNPGKVLRELI